MRFFKIEDRHGFFDAPVSPTRFGTVIHGIAEREGKEYPHDPKIWANSDSPSNLEITRTGEEVPDIFRPSSHLVVNERYADLLRNLPNIRLWPVEFKRLVRPPRERTSKELKNFYIPTFNPYEYIEQESDVAELTSPHFLYQGL